VFEFFAAPRPPGIETVADPEFMRVEAHCPEVFQREVGRHAGRAAAVSK